VGEIWRKRDDAFRVSVSGDVASGIRPDEQKSITRGKKSVWPIRRSLKAIALIKSDVVAVKMDGLDNESDDRHIECFTPIARHNGNTELWVNATASTWDILSKWVLHEYRKSSDDAGLEQAAIDSPSHTTSPVDAELVETPVSDRCSSKRQSADDSPMTGECKPFLKRQASLLSFMKRGDVQH
jgi:hypothetical protein